MSNIKEQPIFTLNLTDTPSMKLQEVVMSMAVHCRLCTVTISEDLTANIFDPERGAILEKIHACLPVIILPTDPYSKNICINCVEQLDLCHDLIEKSIEAEKFFKSPHDLIEEDPKTAEDEVLIAGVKADQLSTEGPVICDICGNKKFSNMETFDSHMEEVHNAPPLKLNAVLTEDGKAVYECSACKHLAESEEELVKHRSIHIDLICKFCGQFHKTIEALHRHRCPNSSIYVCQYCQKQFVSNVDFRAHIQSSHLFEECSKDRSQSPEILDNSPSEDDSLQSKQSSNEEENKSKTHECSLCHRKFCNAGNLARHIACHTEIKQNNLFKNRFQRSNTCEKCKKVFRKQSELVQHLDQEHDVPPIESSIFSCLFCNKKMMSKLSLEIHERIHTGQRPFTCKTCGSGFRSKSNLLQHQSVHTGVRNHQCPVCGKGFSRKSFVKTHLRVHTRVRPFACDVCDARFTQVGDMRRHKKKHCNENGATNKSKADNNLSNGQSKNARPLKQIFLDSDLVNSHIFPLTFEDAQISKEIVEEDEEITVIEEEHIPKEEDMDIAIVEDNLDKMISISNLNLTSEGLIIV